MEENEELDELDQQIIHAIKKMAIREILKDEERKIRRRRKIIKIVTPILAVAAILVVGFFLFPTAGTNIDGKALAAPYIAEVVEEPNISMRGVTSDYNEIIKQLQDSTVDDKKIVIQLAENFKKNATEAEYREYEFKTNYIIALCHIHNGDFDKAEPILLDLNKKLDPEWTMKKNVETLLKDIKK